jgi:hypothetical protein
MVTIFEQGDIIAIDFDPQADPATFVGQVKHQVFSIILNNANHSPNCDSYAACFSF